MRYLSTLLLFLTPLLPLSAQGIDVIEEVEPNDSLHTAQLLEEGVAVVGGVTGIDAEGTCSRPADRYDAYRIPFNRAGTLELTIHPTTGVGNLELGVFSDRQETSPSRNFSFIDSPDTLRVECVQGDTLYLRVKISRSLDCIDYWLSWKGLDPPVMEDNLEPDDRIADAHRVRFGDVMQGRVGYGRQVGTSDPIDYYLLTDVPEGDVTLTFEGDTFSSLHLDLFGPFPNVTLNGPVDSVTLECVGGIDSILLGVSNPSRCLTYSLRATAVPSSDADVEPDVEPNSSTPTALDRSFPLDIEGRIGEVRFEPGVWRDSVDLYRVEMAVGDTMRGYILFHDLTSGRLVLRDAAGEPILSWSQQGLQNPSDTIPIELFAVEPGQMFIAVESGDDDCGFYEAFFTVNGTSSVGDQEGSAGPALVVSGGVIGLRGIGSGVDATIELYDTQGSLVSEADADDLRTLTLPTGIYLYRILSNGELIAEGRVVN